VELPVPGVTSLHLVAPNFVLQGTGLCYRILQLRRLRPSVWARLVLLQRTFPVSTGVERKEGV
jgi:hypothetical protein